MHLFGEAVQTRRSTALSVRKSAQLVWLLLGLYTLTPLTHFSGDNAVIPDVILTPCDTIYTFCCGQDEAARNCCDTRNGTVRLAAASAGPILVAGDTASVTVDPSSLPRVTVTSVISSTTTLLSTPSGGSATGSCKSDNKATIGVGAGLGAAFLVMAAVAAFFAYKWRETDARRRKALGLELQGATGAFAARS